MRTVLSANEPKYPAAAVEAKPTLPSTSPNPAAIRGAARPPVTPIIAAPAAAARPTFQTREDLLSSAFFLVSASADISTAVSRVRAVLFSSSERDESGTSKLLHRFRRRMRV